MTEITEFSQFVKPFVGELEVIGNGTVHVTEDFPLTLKIGKDMEMEFEFLIDKNEKETKILRRIENKKKLIFSLSNFTNSLGSGVVSPTRLGSLLHRALYFSFFIWTPSIDEGKRIINYVVYLGEATAEKGGSNE